MTPSRMMTNDTFSWEISGFWSFLDPKPLPTHLPAIPKGSQGYRSTDLRYAPQVRDEICFVLMNFLYIHIAALECLCVSSKGVVANLDQVENKYIHLLPSPKFHGCYTMNT